MSGDEIPAKEGWALAFLLARELATYRGSPCPFRLQNYERFKARMRRVELVEKERKSKPLTASKIRALSLRLQNTPIQQKNAIA
jgi:hypothetical protein